MVMNYASHYAPCPFGIRKGIEAKWINRPIDHIPAVVEIGTGFPLPNAHQRPHDRRNARVVNETGRIKRRLGETREMLGHPRG